MDIQKLLSKKMLPIAILLLITTNTFAQKIVRYDLYVKDTLVNFAGKEKRAIAVNGQIPMPTLTFTEGDICDAQLLSQIFQENNIQGVVHFAAETHVDKPITKLDGGAARPIYSPLFSNKKF